MNRCPYCRVELDEHGNIASKGDKHSPDCADRPLERSELKRLFRSRPGTPKKTETRTETGRVEWEAYQVTPEEHLTVVLENGEVRDSVVRLLGELAALCAIADGNRSVASDRAGSSGVLAHEMPVPSFDPAAAAAKLDQADKRLWRVYEWLASVVRRPQGPKCGECGKRESLVDEFCGPCGAKILKAHRRDT